MIFKFNCGKRQAFCQRVNGVISNLKVLIYCTSRIVGFFYISTDGAGILRFLYRNKIVELLVSSCYAWLLSRVESLPLFHHGLRDCEYKHVISVSQALFLG